MNKNTKTKKPQAKVAKGKTTKKVSTPTINEKQKKKNSTTKVEEPKVAKRRTWAPAVKDEEPKVAKRITWAAESEEPKVAKRKTPATEVEEPKVVERRTQWVKVEEQVDKAVRLKREECLEKLRQYYHANRDTFCKKQNSKYQDRMQRVKNDPELLAKQKEAAKAYYCQNKD